MKLKKKSLLAIPLSLVMLTPVYASANTAPVPTQESHLENKIEKDQVKLSKSKAFNDEEEKKALSKLGFKNGKIPFKDDQPIVINFDDGSSIEYSLEVVPTPASRIPVAESSVNGLVTTQAIAYKTYYVAKKYVYGSASIFTRLYTDVKLDGRYITVREAYPYFAGTLAKNDSQTTRVIDANGYDTDAVTTELKGQFTLTIVNGVGDYYTRTYMYRMDIEASGLTWLRVIY